MNPAIAPQILADQNLIQTYYIGSDQVILMGVTALVSSKSAPGQWREVDAERGLCSCPGFQARGRCRHVSAVHAAEEQDRASAIVSDPLADLAAAILPEYDGREDLSACEKKALAKTTAKVRLGVI